MNIGRWWYKDEEIDIVALQGDEKKILFGECKWTNKPIGIKIIKELEKKAAKVGWKNKERREYFALFSKAGFGKNAVDYAEKNENWLLFDLDDLTRIFH